ncbi:WD repeat-containing protein 1 [Hondaea fermentalgiana]|uniref:Cilia- and flagella-associated protein 52 n=1 Tax=Hondaea fermentalgiana TaxID=2315210 RepID=A0A2R5G931_9STRA|nr:WD repeat-containing protein 1 [Hondaea fermentalgiana]|eukprot:GBG27510.1 WD repeat-containing protein 1 [Hondaea fermentalgiana]
MDPVELEHVIGFSGEHSKVLCGHPKNADLCLMGMGCNVVIQDLRDDHNQRFLQGHDETVSVVAVSAKGTLAASGQEGSRRMAIPEAQVIVWDLAQQVDVYRLKGIRQTAVCLAFSGDEVFLAGSGRDGTLYVWDMQTGEIIASLGLGSGLVPTALEWGPARRVEGSRRPEYVLYATVGPQVLSFQLRYSVGNMQYEVSKLPFRLPAGLIREYLDVCHMCAAGVYVFVGGGDGTIKRLTGRGAEWRLDAEMSVFGSVTNLSASGSERVLVGTSEGRCYELDVATLKVLREFQSETASVVAVAFKASCSIRFATLNAAGMVRVWDLSDYSVVTQAQPRHRDVGTCLAFDDVASEVIVGFASGAVRAWREVKSDAAPLSWEIATAHRDGVSSVCATQLYYATGGLRGGVRLWARSSRAQLFEFSDHVGRAVTSVLPDCRAAHLLHSCGEDRSIFTYDLKKERRMVQHQIPQQGGVPSSMTQRLDSENELITASSDGRICTWDFDLDQLVSEVSVHGSKALGFTAVRVSPGDGAFLAAAATDGRVRVWALSSGRLLATSAGNTVRGIQDLAWSPDQKQLVAVASDKCIAVWNVYLDDDAGDEEAKAAGRSMGHK